MGVYGMKIKTFQDACSHLFAMYKADPQKIYLTANSQFELSRRSALWNQTWLDVPWDKDLPWEQKLRRSSIQLREQQYRLNGLIGVLTI